MLSLEKWLKGRHSKYHEHCKQRSCKLLQFYGKFFSCLRFEINFVGKQGQGNQYQTPGVKFESQPVKSSICYE